MRCASCGYSRPSGTVDVPAFHKPGCKVRRALKAAERKSTPSAMNYRGRPAVTIGGDINCKLDDHGAIVAAISFDGLRWRASA